MKTILLWTMVFFSACGGTAQQEITNGSVLAVHRRDKYAHTAGSNPSDAPLMPEVHAYDISVRINCAVLVGHYDKGFEYFPSTLEPGNSVPVRVGKHSLYFDLPGFGKLKMPIVKRKRDRSQSCNGSSKARANLR